jgi:hypothetical protein
MINQNCIPANYTVSIEVAKTPTYVFDHLVQLSKWWPEEFVGTPIALNSEFILKTRDEHFSKNKVIEFVPDLKLVWLTTESLRKTDKYDWTGTKFIFELTPKGDNTLLKFTYDGVVLENETERLAQVCDMCIKEILYNFITNKK